MILQRLPVVGNRPPGDLYAKSQQESDEFAKELKDRFPEVVVSEPQPTAVVSLGGLMVQIPDSQKGDDIVSWIRNRGHGLVKNPPVEAAII